MDFLPHDYECDDSASMLTLEKLETMIRTCSLDNKSEMINKISRISEAEAMEMINYLRQYMPRFNSEATAHTIREQREAIKNAADKDDFYESRHRK